MTNSDFKHELGEALIYVDSNGYIHVGDDELSWKLSPEQAKVWAKQLWALSKEVEQ